MAMFPFAPRAAATGAAILAALSLPALPAVATGQTLQPHRAVYDVSLARAEPNASMTAASGRLVFELTGSACEGFVVNSRFVTRVTDRAGNMRVTDLRSNTFETLEPATFTFLNQTYIDDALASEVKGKAQGRAGGVVVTLTAPTEEELTLGRALFPTAHTLLILEAAEAGERVLEAPVFDGGEDADTIYDTTTVIGPARTDLPGASEAERDVLSAMDAVGEADAWRLVISYFEKGGDAGGETTPDYELSFTILRGGVSYDVAFDYGSFELTGRLTELEILDAPQDDC